jgi:hypothetical protein
MYDVPSCTHIQRSQKLLAVSASFIIFIFKNVVMALNAYKRYACAESRIPVCGPSFRLLDSVGGFKPVNA